MQAPWASAAPPKLHGWSTWLDGFCLGLVAVDDDGVDDGVGIGFGQRRGTLGGGGDGGLGDGGGSDDGFDDGVRGGGDGGPSGCVSGSVSQEAGQSSNARKISPSIEFSSSITLSSKAGASCMTK